MEHETILANLHLHAVMPNMAKVAVYDPVAREITAGWKGTVQFAVLGGPAVHLVFDNGKATAEREKVTWPTLGFTFATCAQANKMFTGKGIAIPMVWGLWHPMMLKGFLKLSKRLEFYLKPGPQTVSDPTNKKFIVELMLNTIVNGIAILARLDHHAIQLGQTSPRGSVEFRVLPNGPVMNLVHMGDGKFTAAEGPAVKASAVMEFKDVDTAWGVFNNELDAMILMGLGDIRIRGLVPLVDNVSGIMDILSRYLA